MSSNTQATGPANTGSTVESHVPLGIDPPPSTNSDISPSTELDAVSKSSRLQASTDRPLQENTSKAAPRKLCKVLHIINGEYYSGAERVQDLLAACLPEFGFAVDFAVLKEGKFNESRKYRKALVHQCTMHARLDLRVITQLTEIVDEYGYEILHAHTPRSVMVGSRVATRCNLPLVYHVHSPTSRDSTRSLMNRVNSVTERMALNDVDHLVTVSDSLAQHVLEMGVPRNRITTIANGVPIVKDRPLRSDPKSPWTLSTIALFRPRKGTEVLLKALEILRKEGIDVRLRAVGTFETEDYEQHLRELTTSYGIDEQVEWLGFQQDVNQQLAQSDIFVLPSLFGEGMPMVVLEAMAMGVPVVGTNVEGVPEVVRDGLDGRIAEPGDPHDLADAIASIINDDFQWRTLSDTVVARHRDAFSDRAMAAGMSAIYRDILRASAARPTR